MNTVSAFSPIVSTSAVDRSIAPTECSVARAPHTATKTALRTILIAEDNIAACEGLRQLVTMAGFRASTASDGAEALEKLRDEPFDVMLLDIWMPKLTGLDVLEQLRDAPHPPKVLVMTADDTPETLLMTLRKQAHQFVRKPIEPKALLELLRSIETAPREEPQIEVLSARPAWVELLVSCSREAADRIQSYIVNLDVDLPTDIRETMGQVFRELLLDAMDCDMPQDPQRKVRVAYLRAQKMMMFRIGDATAPGGAAAPAYVLAPRLSPGAILARAQADELLYNEARNEVVVVKYLD